jgi:DNA-binding CsgD family transcriptional regulator
MASSIGDKWGTPANESERALRAAIDAALGHSSDPLVAFDLESRLILDANGAAHHRLGVPPGALAGLAFCEVMEPIDEEAARAAKRLLTSGDIDSFGATRYVRKPNGGVAEIHIWVRLVTAPGAGFGLATLEDEVGHARSLVAKGAETTGRAKLDLVRGPISLFTEPDLSERQREILTLLIGGETIREIAAMTYLSPSTVRNHLSAIYKKFGVHSQAALVAKVLGGWSGPPEVMSA